MRRCLDTIASFSKWAHKCAVNVSVEPIDSQKAMGWLNQTYQTPTSDSGRRAKAIVTRIFRAPIPTSTITGGHHEVMADDEILLVHHWQTGRLHEYKDHFCWLLVRWVK